MSTKIRKEFKCNGIDCNVKRKEKNEPIGWIKISFETFRVRVSNGAGCGDPCDWFSRSYPHDLDFCCLDCLNSYILDYLNEGRKQQEKWEMK